MSGLPPIATELMQRRELTRCATSGLMNGSERHAADTTCSTRVRQSRRAKRKAPEGDVARGLKSGYLRLHS
jgi:hypothetical protein